MFYAPTSCQIYQRDSQMVLQVVVHLTRALTNGRTLSTEY